MKKVNRKGISPVIATVIIVAVAIAIAIAVAYWVLGIVPAFTRYEELKIMNCYITSNGRNVTITIKNTGTADITITDVFINGKLPSEFNSTAIWQIETTYTTETNYASPLNILLPAGNQTTIVLFSTTGRVFEAGVVYEFTIKTAAGGSYPVTARAP